MYYTTSGNIWGSPTKKPKSAKLPLCKITGHDWIATNSPNVELCSRLECGTVRMLVKGHWRHTHKVKGSLEERKHKAEQLEQVTQRRLFE